MTQRIVEFVLTGQMPSGKNAVLTTRTGRHYPNKRFKAWRNDAIAQLAVQLAPIKTIRGRCLVSVTYTPGDRRRRDVPGMMDALCHLLERMRVVDDDSQFIAWEWWTTDVGAACVRVRISELEGGER